jgi:hypothetical protein
LQSGKKVEFMALEFDWIFRGEFGKSFIANLAESENDDLFSIHTIKLIILFLWERFFWRIFFKIFLPFVLYVAIFCLYVTFIF